ncbi:MAG: hypothetical protein NTV63_00405 [Candidatus Woesearchaeota archaeon]|nr:hypothetical protein [Candidatus Woesearchaeota archaeon]
MPDLTGLGITKANLERILLLEGSSKAVFERKISIETAEFQRKANYLSITCGKYKEGNVSELHINKVICDWFKECSGETYKEYLFKSRGLSVENHFFSCEDNSFFIQNLYIDCTSFFQQENDYSTVQTIRVDDKNDIPIVEITGAMCPKRGIVNLECKGDLPAISQKISAAYERAAKKQEFPYDSNFIGHLLDRFKSGRC